MKEDRARTEPQWRFDVDGLMLVIMRRSATRWEALYGGFSRSTGGCLGDAIAVATGAHPREPWITDIVRRVLGGLPQPS